MKPTKGKWYTIKYGRKGRKRSYHGPARCLHFSNMSKMWVFRAPNQPDEQCEFAYMLFREKDIVEETHSYPTYEDLLERIKELENERDSD